MKYFKVILYFCKKACNMKPKISIIITIYNRERFIEECARSLFEQTLDDIEYIFVDDASTDNSIDILHSLICSYPKRGSLIKIIHLEKNGGVSNARRIGMEQVSGEYVIHADSDDWVEKDMYERLYQKAKETQADIVGCNICNEYLKKKSVLCQKYGNTIDENIRNLIRGDIHPSLCTSLTRLKLITDNNIIFPDGLNMGEDLFYNLQLYLCARKIIGMDFAPYHYRHTNESSSFHHTRQTIDSGIMIGRQIEKMMRMKNRYDEFANDIEFRKFSLKLSLVYQFDNIEDYHYWLGIFPETHKNIWKYKQIDWKLRLELWFAVHRMFTVSRIINKIIKWQHKIRRFLFVVIISLI